MAPSALQKRQGFTSPPTSTSSSSGGSGMSPAVIGGVVAGLIVIAIVFFAVGRFLSRRAAVRHAATSGPQTETTQTSGARVTLPGSARNPRGYNRRQDSGASVRSIPLYHEQAAANELVLIKPHNDESPRPSFDHASSMEEGRSIETGSSVHLLPPAYGQTRSRSSSEPPMPDESTLSLVRSQSPAQLPPATRRRGSSSASLQPPRPAHLREAFYSLTNRSHHSVDSNASLLSISAPLPGSLSHPDYVLPKAGLSREQMSFISSNENLNKLGVYASADERPPSFVEATSVNASPAIRPSTAPMEPSSGVGAPEEVMVRPASPSVQQ